jgi:hypothetical protein
MFFRTTQNVLVGNAINSVPTTHDTIFFSNDKWERAFTVPSQILTLFSPFCRSQNAILDLQWDSSGICLATCGAGDQFVRLWMRGEHGRHIQHALPCEKQEGGEAESDEPVRLKWAPHSPSKYWKVPILA